MEKMIEIYALDLWKTTIFSNQNNIKLSVFENAEFLNFYQSSIQRLFAKELDALLYPLHLIPIEKPKNIAITALVERKNPSETILIKKEKLVPNQLLKLEKGASFTVFTDLQAAQIHSFRPDLIIEKKRWNVAIENKNLNFSTDGCIFPTAWLDEAATDFLAIETQPEEIVPTPGQGALALICLRDNLPLRRFLKKFHQPNISAATNVERGIEQVLREPVSVFCRKDAANHFHVYAKSLRAEQLFQFNHSATSSAGLIHRIATELGG